MIIFYCCNNCRTAAKTQNFTFKASTAANPILRFVEFSRLCLPALALTIVIIPLHW